MKTATPLQLALAFSLSVSSVLAHGLLTEPKPRPVTAAYRKDCYFGLKGAGDSELMMAPLENLRTRDQKDQPAAPTFDIMNGCRGMNYEVGNPVTELTAGADFPVAWNVQAPHPGYMELYIVKPKKDASGKITYEQDGAAFNRVENFASGGGAGTTSATLPTGVTGCEKAGDCALQFYWHSAQAGQTYVNCADIVVKGSGGGGGVAPNPTAETPAADAGVDAGTIAPVTPKPVTSAPASTPSAAPSSAPAPTSTKKKCTGKLRRRRH